ncbi:MAG TPA: RNA polymerase sigma factor [Tepidisphaeraceae bacterium]|nr:RNA polymerase sigma factor [Tepidisphaeraceae bacterium]
MQEPSSELVSAASRGKRHAVIQVLAIHYPMVYRIAAGLTGRRDVAQGVVRFVLQQSLRALHLWTDPAAPTRWFYHHTILTIRRAHKHQPDATSDTLLGEPGEPQDQPDPAYLAFVRALRSLPQQQREAFILRHGEKLEIRQIAIAMDCSTLAAANHLQQAEQHLVALAADRYHPHVLRMHRTYQSLHPAEELTIRDVRRRIRRLLLPWGLKRVLGSIVTLLLLAAALWGAWWVWKIVQHSL